MRLANLKRSPTDQQRANRRNGVSSVALSEIDRNLLQRCLARKPRSWEDFVDRYMGLVIHVVNHSAQSRSLRLAPEDREDLIASVFLAIVKDDFARLRNFRGESSLATYLTVVARRIVVAQILKLKPPSRLAGHSGAAAVATPAEMAMAGAEAEQRVSDRDEVERLLAGLDVAEAQIVRMYHLEGKSYQEISSAVGMPENSVGPTLSRARKNAPRRTLAALQETARQQANVMDDNQLTSAPVDACYRCPGESRAIDRATHLNRLATFYPACRHCNQREDIQLLPTAQARHWAEILRRGVPRVRVASEGLDADSVNDLGGDVVRRFATALGALPWRLQQRGNAPPAAIVGADGHWSTAELVSSACAALQRAGCRTIDAGAVTTASLATIAHRLRTDAALWIGNAGGSPHGMSLRVWGSAGRPWSSPGELDRVLELYETGADRPKRSGGTLERISAEVLHRSALEPLFHALRPLRFVVDTKCAPLVRSLERLAATAACIVLRLDTAAALPDSMRLASEGGTHLERRLQTIGRQVVAESAHFGLWIDGAGESCHLIDQRGVVVEGERCCRLLAAYVCRQQPQPTIVLAPGCTSDLIGGAAEPRGARDRRRRHAGVDVRGARIVWRRIWRRTERRLVVRRSSADSRRAACGQHAAGHSERDGSPRVRSARRGLNHVVQRGVRRSNCQPAGSSTLLRGRIAGGLAVMTHPWIARRTEYFDSSGIRKVFDLASTMTDAINLSIGQPDFPVPRPIQDAAVQAIHAGRNGYTPTQGIAELRNELQRRIDAQYGHSMRQVFVTSGTSGGLVLAMMALVDPGDEVIVFDPYFVMYKSLVGLVGGKCVLIDTHPDFRIDVAKVADAITKRTKVVLFNSPANPTGIVSSDEEIRGLAQLCSERNVALVSDEIYHEFCYDRPFVSPAKYNPQTLVIDGFSKTYAMTGWRLGFAHGPAEVIQQMIKLQQYTFVCAPQPAQWAGLKALDVDMSATHRRLSPQARPGRRRPGGRFRDDRTGRRVLRLSESALGQWRSVRSTGHRAEAVDHSRQHLQRAQIAFSTLVRGSGCNARAGGGRFAQFGAKRPLVAGTAAGEPLRAGVALANRFLWRSWLHVIC